MNLSHSEFFQIAVGMVLVLLFVFETIRRARVAARYKKKHGRPIKPANPANENAALYQIITTQIENASGADRVVLVSLIADYLNDNLTAVPVGTLRLLKRRLQLFNATKGEWVEKVQLKTPEF
jgi:hypothetical protein